MPLTPEMRAILAIVLVLPIVIAMMMALFVLLSPPSSLDETPPRRTQTQAANSSLRWQRLFSSFWRSSPCPYNNNDDANISIDCRGYYHHIDGRDEAEPAYDEDGIGEAAPATDEDVQDYRHYHTDIGKADPNSDASEAPVLGSVATNTPDANRHLATSSDRHNVAVWAHKDIYDPLIYSYDNHTFTAQRNTDSNSNQVGQWRHIRGATKADGTETIIVGISKDEKWVRGMLLRESAGAGGVTAWEQIVPGTGTERTGVLATLSTNQYAAVDVQYESNSEDALLVWST